MFKSIVLLSALALLTGGALAQTSDHGRIMPPGFNPASSPPFANGMWAGGVFYVGGHIGIDPATGNAAAEVDNEVKLLLDGVQDTLKRGGLSMDDLVSVTIYCTDLSLYDKFNAAYRTYFHDGFPPRAFIGASKLVRNAHFEIQGVAVRMQPAKKK